MDFLLYESPVPYLPIYLGKHAEIFAVVDREDYAWAHRWCWDITWDKHGRKAYATRIVNHKGRRVKIFLHKAVLVRTGKRRPTRHHKIGDHKNGESLDCRRCNLRWATPSMNRRNIRKLPDLEKNAAG